MEQALRMAWEESLRYRVADAERRVASKSTPAQLRERLGGPAPEQGTAPEVVVRALIEGASPGLHNNTGGRFFGWVMGGSTPASLAADWLTSAWDQNPWLFATSPAASICEEIAGAWLKEMLGLPTEASFAFVTGCQMAHTTCLAAARHRVLARAGWDVEECGLHGAPEVRVLAPEDRHGSVDRSLQLLGLGRRCLTTVRDGWERELASTEGKPAIVVLQAGELNTGRCDDFSRLIPLARRHGAWVHIDGAFGLWAQTSGRFRVLTRGVEAADSWATDGHKWLNVPFDCGYAFVRDAEAHRGAMAHITPYQMRTEGVREPLDWTPEWSRRARGFATYSALRELGRQGIARILENCCDAVAAIVRGVAALPGAEIVAPPQLNQALVAFGGDERTERVAARVREDGAAFFGTTMYQGRRCMRISLVNWSTSVEDVEVVVRAIEAAAKS